MAVSPITKNTELNSARIVLNAAVITMCNETSLENLVTQFALAKDLLIEIYKYKASTVESASTDTSKK